MTWVLLLALVGPAGDVVQLAPVATPFATREACNHAGVLARARLPVLTPPGSSLWSRVDWVCLPTGSAP